MVAVHDHSTTRFRELVMTGTQHNNNATAKRLIDLKMRDCRWVCEEPTKENDNHWLYCGQRTWKETSSYCEGHHKIVFEAPTDRDNRMLKVTSRMLR